MKLKLEWRSKAGGVKVIEERAEGMPTIGGLASVYYTGDPGTEYVLWDFPDERAVERIMPGAFDKAIGADVRALFNHEADNILGRTTAGTLKLSLEPAGLGYQVDPPDTPLGRSVVESVRRGDITGSSFAFRATDVSWRIVRQDGQKDIVIREIRAVELFDVGPVTFPAYESATAGLRAVSLAGQADVRAEFEAWKETQQVVPVWAQYAARACEVMAE